MIFSCFKFSWISNNKSAIQCLAHHSKIEQGKFNCNFSLSVAAISSTIILPVFYFAIVFILFLFFNFLSDQVMQCKKRSTAPQFIDLLNNQQRLDERHRIDSRTFLCLSILLVLWSRILFSKCRPPHTHIQRQYLTLM